jgi:EXLDI family protein
MNTTQETIPTLPMYTLRRDDKPPLRFRGRQLAYADTAGPNSTRWTEVTVYRTAGGKCVLYIREVSQWQGEGTSRWGWTVSRPTEIPDYIRSTLDCMPEDISRMLSRLEEMPEFHGIWVEEVD